MMSRTKKITLELTERQAELTVIALLEAICEIQDNPEKARVNNSQEQEDRRVTYDLIRSMLPKGFLRSQLAGQLVQV